MALERELVMPKLGLTMTEGAVAEWSIQPGARFTAGQILFVVESDKTAVEIEAPADGVLHEILVPAGDTVPVGTEIGRWTLDGDKAAAPTADAAPRPSADPAPAARIVATPLARRRAVAGGIDLAEVTGTGPRGRVVAADVDAAIAAHGGTREPTAAGAHVAALTPHQRTMAARVTASKRDIPHFYLSIDVDTGELLALRASLNELPGRPRVSVTHLLVAAVVEALRRVPSMNRVWSEDGVRNLPAVDVGLAIDTPQGLMSPVVHDLAARSFFGVVRSVDEVIARARSASLRPTDFEGGAITVSNAGMHDVRYMGSIIVPGQSAILGVGSVQSCFRPDAAGRPVARRELGMVLSADHRLHTGVSALAFLGELKSILQRPLALIAGVRQPGSD